jgi:cancer susceptibility candidate protein 1
VKPILTIRLIIKLTLNKEEKKYSWSTVFAWLYLKTIGRILPKRWNKWAENILHYDKATGNNGVQTDGLKTVDESIQIDLKPGVAEKESQSEVMSKDREVQTDQVTFQDTAMQTECVETTDKSFQANLESERERKLKDENEELERQLKQQKESLQLEINRLKESLQKPVEEKKRLEKEFGEERTQLKSKIQSLTQQLTEKEREIAELRKQMELLEEEKEIFAKFFAEQAQQFADLQLGNGFLEEENGELRSKLAELEKNYRELAEVTKKREEGFLAKLEEKSKEILKLNKELIECSIEFANKTERLLIKVEEKDTKINSLTLLSKGLDEGKKAMEAKNEDLQAQVTELEENLSVKEKELIKQLEGVNQALEASTLSYDDTVHQMEELQLKINFLEEENGKLRSINEELENNIRKIFEGAEKKCMKINSLTSLNKGLYKDLQGEN